MPLFLLTVRKHPASKENNSGKQNDTRLLFYASNPQILLGIKRKMVLVITLQPLGAGS